MRCEESLFALPGIAARWLVSRLFLFQPGRPDVDVAIQPNAVPGDLDAERLHATVDSQFGTDKTRTIVNFPYGPRDACSSGRGNSCRPRLAARPGRAFRKTTAAAERRGWASRVSFASTPCDRTCDQKREFDVTESRPPLPPFTRETAAQKVRGAEDGWNSCNPQRVSLAYTPDSYWRNRSEFLRGRDEIVAFLTRKWMKELDYRLIKELWAFYRPPHRRAVRLRMA